jgi:hypothetical protein
VNWVRWAVLAIGVAALLVEIVTVVGRRLGADPTKWWTISQVFRRDGRQWLAIPFGWGVLSGHYFATPFPYARWQSYLLIALGLGVIARDFWNRRHPAPVSKRILLAVFLAGVAAGWTLWSQG